MEITWENYSITVQSLDKSTKEFDDPAITDAGKIDNIVAIK
jgi:hypothetical protein